jgi:hypothetical protein
LKNYLTLSDSVSFAVISEVKDAIVATLALWLEYSWRIKVCEIVLSPNMGFHEKWQCILFSVNQEWIWLVKISGTKLYYYIISLDILPQQFDCFMLWNIN